MEARGESLDTASESAQITNPFTPFGVKVSPSPGRHAMNRALPLLCAALFSLSACEDNGGTLAPPPPADLVVHLSAAPSQVFMQPGPQGQPLLNCTFTIIAIATGDMAARADWTGGNVRFFVDGNAQPVSSMVLSGFQLKDLFGGPFSPTLSGAAQLSVTANTAFSMEMDVSYRVQNNDTHRTATTRTRCDPPTANLTGRTPTFAALLPSATASALTRTRR
ncbi:MAG TPA: hypothetical protein VEQ60_31195 [Longimicrobium sp.]|nr:hypothetical protein [Longimicrobium sp.]